MRRATANNRAKADQHVAAPGMRQPLGRRRQFPCAGHPDECHRGLVAAVPPPTIEGALDQLASDEFVETTGDQAKALAAGVIVPGGAYAIVKTATGEWRLP